MHYRARALLWVILILPTLHCGILKYPRSQIGAISEARSYCGQASNFPANLPGELHAKYHSRTNLLVAYIGVICKVIESCKHCLNKANQRTKIIYDTNTSTNEIPK